MTTYFMDIDRKTIKVLSSDTRIEILKSLKERRKMPSELARELSLRPSTIVSHLEKLQKAGLIDRKETGRKWIYYELTRNGENIIRPKVSVPFVLILTLGMILVFSGAINVSYETQSAFDYPIITIEKTITRIASPEIVTTTASESVSGVATTGSTAEIMETEYTENKTEYETGYIDVQSVNWLAFGIMTIGIILVIISISKIYIDKKMDISKKR
ncbi:MAG: winged helix-turn-helix domain-containing protein [Nanoarchaeota archaeon]|nr:winged helix-turn-helix domain-containing protein [Nanoarchaeota archaeon]